MKNKILFLAITLWMALSLPLSAEDITVDGIKYSTSGTTATVTGCTITIGDVIIPETLTYNGNTYSVTSIEYRAFFGCAGLTSISIPNSVTSIGLSAFFSCISLKSITLPNGITSIENATFCNCMSLTSIVIPNSVTSIGSGVFFNCTSLTSISIPNSVTKIGGECFMGCTGLTSITIPASVTSIGSYAFSGCTELSSITCLSETPPIVISNTFEFINISLCTLYVKKKTAPFYASAYGWQTFTRIIEIGDR